MSTSTPTLRSTQNFIKPTQCLNNFIYKLNHHRNRCLKCQHEDSPAPKSASLAQIYRIDCEKDGNMQINFLFNHVWKLKMQIIRNR